MKPYCLILLLLLFAKQESIAQSTFSRLYNMADSSRVTSVPYGIWNDDSSIYIAGSYINHNTYKINNFLARLDLNGHIIWRKTYSYPGKNSHFVSSTGFKRAQNGDFLILTLADSVDTTHNALIYIPMLRRVDVNGNVLYEKKVPVDNHPSWLYDVIELNNGDFAFAGTIDSKTFVARVDMWGRINYFPSWKASILLKTDSSLNFHWRSVGDTSLFGEGALPSMFRMAILNDSLIIQIGSKRNRAIPNSRLGAFTAHDFSGTKLWDVFIPSRYKLTGLPFWGDIAQVEENRYFFISQQADSLFAPAGLSFLNSIVYGYMNAQGDTTSVMRKRYKIYVPDLYVDQLIVLPDKSKLISTLAQNMQNGIGLTKLAPNDSLLWERTIRYVTVDSASTDKDYRRMLATQNGDIYLTTSVYKYGSQWDSTGTYSWLVKLDSFGCLIPGCHLGDSIFRPDPAVSIPIVQFVNLEWSVYPNPVTDMLNIELKGEQIPSNLKIGILNLEGKLLQEVPCENGKTTIDLKSLASGIYLCRLRSAEGVISYYKIIKAR